MPLHPFEVSGNLPLIPLRTLHTLVKSQVPYAPAFTSRVICSRHGERSITILRFYPIFDS